MKSKKNKKILLVKKRSHKLQEFNKDKFKKSILRTGIPQSKSEEIVKEVEDNLGEQFSTSILHNFTRKALSKRSKIYAANYDIKRSIYNLGPTGYPFEILCSEMLKAKGYKTTISVIKKGQFVKHEVDIIAERADGDIFCECKFHNSKYFKNDIKVPLYVHSRSLDIKEANPDEKFSYALFSNTQFSKDAIMYSQGVGLHLYSMNYPYQNTFIDIIKNYKIYPITVLKSLLVRHKKKLLEKGIVVIKQVMPENLADLGLSLCEVKRVFNEIKVLTHPRNGK